MKIYDQILTTASFNVTGVQRKTAFNDGAHHGRNGHASAWPIETVARGRSRKADDRGARYADCKSDEASTTTKVRRTKMQLVAEPAGWSEDAERKMRKRRQQESERRNDA